ncbi:AAA family ATPase [Actinacidiphila sp. bgisy144]|uniref:AAA family ATPase n=1 Tax=Actinacidiphila sp. bgisy144 TaxID=3413791 RepID=UPI003EBD0971
MIRSLRIERFKCFVDTTLELRPLTVLTGFNGAGKSTVLQSLLLARQAAVGADGAVRLNGPYGLALGEAHELLHPDATTADICVSGRSDEESWTYRFGVPDGRALHLNVVESPQEPSPQLVRPGFGFTYLGAERLGPRDVLAVSGEPPDDLGVGVRGEHTAQVLALRELRITRKALNVREELTFPHTDVNLLRAQTEAWASHIIRPLRLEAHWAAGMAASALRVQGENGDAIRPANTGFGVSYALPVIVAGLMTSPGDVLIVENPEAHLHPAGQSRLGAFLARVAGSGVQVIVETHSDHVLNGVRLASAVEGLLPPADTIVQFFDHRGITSIELGGRGDLSQWPPGFFDQIEDDLGRLARARRRG